MFTLYILIEHGEIREQGTHVELIQNDGAYARLFNIQNIKDPVMSG